jgi:phosphatidate cytidylyltransferase
MIKKNFLKRLFTSIVLITLLSLMFFSSFVLIITLIFISVISYFEFNRLIAKVFMKRIIKYNYLKKLFNCLGLLYLFFLVLIILFIESSGQFGDIYKLFIFYSILVSISSDIGGYIIGNIFKGKKLSKLSPNKTISGSIGSFIFPLFLIPFFINSMITIPLILLILITLVISLISQLGDLFISYLKRQANVKDTGNLLPGHGGLLDRIDGILFALPAGLVLLELIS